MFLANKLYMSTSGLNMHLVPCVYTESNYLYIKILANSRIFWPGFFEFCVKFNYYIMVFLYLWLNSISFRFFVLFFYLSQFTLNSVARHTLRLDLTSSSFLLPSVFYGTFYLVPYKASHFFLLLLILSVWFCCCRYSHFEVANEICSSYSFIGVEWII